MSSPSSTHLPSLGQFILSALGLLILVFFAAAFMGLGVFNIFSVGVEDSGTVMLFSSLWTAALMALLILPSLLLSGFRLAGKTLTLPALPPVRHFVLGNLLLLAWLLALAVGQAVARQGAVAWLLLPLFQVFAVALPIGFFLMTALRGLQAGSPQRVWGLVSFGIVFSQPLIILIEGVVILFFSLTALAWVSTQPGMLEALQRLAERLLNAQSNPRALETILLPYLQNPAVIFGGLLMSAGLIPLVEEIFKPLALWTLAGKRLTPAQGFAGGAVCGAVFALVESLGMMSAAPAEGWAFSAVGRMGTGTLHIATAALTGWGLALAWQERRFVRLGVIFFVSVFFHSTWNVFGLLAGLSDLVPAASLASRLASAAPAALAFLTLILFTLLVIGNRLMQREQFRQDTAPLPEINHQ